MANPNATLGFQAESNPALGHSVIGFRSTAADQEVTFVLSVLFAFFHSLGGATRPTTLIGGGATALDGIAAGLLTAIPNDFVLELFPGNNVVARYRIRPAGADTESAPWRVVCDHDATRMWELLGVSKQGVPCVWNPDTEKWHQQLGSGTDDAVTPALAQEDDAFSLPA